MFGILASVHNYLWYFEATTGTVVKAVVLNGCDIKLLLLLQRLLPFTALC